MLRGLAHALRLLLAAALLAGWQQALVHPLVHVDEEGHFVHPAGGCDSHEKEGSGGADALCDAIAALAACVDTAGFGDVSPPAAGVHRAGAAICFSPGSSAPPYFGQAPPARS